MDEKELKEILLKNSEKFQKAHQLHQKFEKQLEVYKKKGFLTEEEKLKEKEIKKKKLILKDKMYFLMSEYQRRHQT